MKDDKSLIIMNIIKRLYVIRMDKLFKFKDYDFLTNTFFI